MTRKTMLGASIASAALVGWACGGSSLNPVGVADGGGTGESSSGGATTSSSGGTSSGGATSSSGATTSSSGGTSSGGATSSSGGSSSGSQSGDDGGTVTGSSFVCGTGANAAVCDPPDVCCTGTGGGAGPGGGGAAAAKCEAQSACTTGISSTCSAESCPSGSYCCATITVGAKGDEGSTACVVGGCGNALQLCSNATPCPTGDRCEALAAGGGGVGAGGGDIDVCRAGATPPADAGKPIADAATD